MDNKTRQAIVQILSSSGLLSEEQVKTVLSKEEIYRARLQKARGAPIRRGRAASHEISLIDIIDSLQLKSPGKMESVLTEEVMMKAIAGHLGLPFVKIDPLSLDSEVATKIIPRLYALKHQLVAVRREGNVLTVATSNPFDRDGIEGLKQSTGYDVAVVVSTKAEIQKIITEFYGFKSSVAAAHEELSAQIDLGNLEQYVKLKSMPELGGTDQHIINAVEYLLHYAYSQRASDIHIEPKRNHSLIRFRIDGILHVIHKIPKPVHMAFVSRIKTLARMDISEKRRPQDGRIKTDREGKEIELRISTLPVAFGEKVVIRVFDPGILVQDLSSLGFLDRELRLFQTFIASPYGLILVTGPTGSGKTTTLYSALKPLATPGVNVTTIEDPVEMVYEEFNQTSIKPQLDITFSNVLRTILRQDPDIIMVGEIRDFETAENAIQAALTGHLVLSTLHTNDAPSSITRLFDLGIQPFLINSTLIGVVAQRLVRKVCSHCAEPSFISEDERAMLGITRERMKDANIVVGSGCPQCRGTGYLGRTGIFEVLDITDKIRTAINMKEPPGSIRNIARGEGLVTLRECAVEIFLKGITTFDEMVRVTGALT